MKKSSIAETKTKFRRTKTGCMTCRARKVKCDETRPKCAKCADRDIKCVWFDRNLSARSTPSPLAITERPGVTLPPLNPTNLRVLHHFIISTSYTIPHAHIPNTMLYTPQTISPLAVFSPGNSFLVHSILCAGAIHLALETNLPEFHILAKSHFRSAIAIARAEPQSDISNRDLLSPRLLGNSLLRAYVSATGCIQSQLLFSEIILLLCRGMIFLAEDVIPLNNLDISTSTFIIPSNRPPLTFPTQRFFSLIDLSICIDPEELTDDPLVYSAYHAAVVSLEFAWRMFNDPHYVITDIAFARWAKALPTRFMTLLLERRQRALIILAYYCAMRASTVSLRYWYLQGIRRDLSKIVSMIQPGQWYGEMTWPMSVL